MVRNSLTDEANHFHDAWSKITGGTNLEFYNNTIKQKLTYLNNNKKKKEEEEEEEKLITFWKYGYNYFLKYFYLKIY